ncbi:hypothetical protein DH2020_019571 [Rehmannia glutinosa]|uniref:CONSTANS-like protein n=1 Tax=Rehmannia glutinosa TaxID=99300 RepID=A0ABR0WNG0_REHGL
MNMCESTKVSNALGAKTARACDSCLLKRARWFCASDDAFLCQACDASIHSANQLASRHERVRLETTSMFKCREMNSNSIQQPSWHQGFTRKARTKRQTMNKKKSPRPANHPPPLVPEINVDEDPFSTEDNEDQLFYTVPVFEPFADDDRNRDLNLDELLSTCDDDFADLIGISDGKRVKIEEDNDIDDEVQAVIACHFDPALDMELNLNWDFDYESSREEDVKVEAAINNTTTSNNNNMLRLNYEAVMAAWATQGSPWTNGIRPQFNNIDEFMVACLGGGVYDNSCGGLNNIGGRWGMSDAEREARVSRYREKRRTRLFSKKIRYQVRKLNAEKRPRMKGRFVKRPTFNSSASSFPNYLINK